MVDLQITQRLLDTWDRNGSTSGPTPWQIYDDDDSNYPFSFYMFYVLVPWSGDDPSL